MKEQLQYLRKQMKLTQADVAEIIGVQLTTYQKYERDVIAPPYDKLLKIADFYGVTTDYLLGRTPLPDPFADLGISSDDEKAALEKYLSLPNEVRAAILHAMREIVNAMNTHHGDDIPEK